MKNYKRESNSIYKYTLANLNLRSSKSTSGDIITVIPQGSKVEILDGNPPGGYDFEYFKTDMTRFVNDNNIKSPTNNLITTDLENKITYIFKKGDNKLWILLYKWSCTVGKPETPTIKGTFYVTGRKPYFGSDSYRVKYATRIRGSYYYHSVLFNAQGTEIINDTLGAALSHGCIRLAVENAQWIYDNILDTTTIIIN